jgi:hypothetical protein
LIHFALLTGVQAVLTIAFYIGALVFVLTRRARLTPRAATFAIWGVGLLLGGWLFSIAWPLVFNGYSATIGSGSDFVTLAAMMSFVTGAIHLAAIVLLLLAHFEGRPAAAYGPAAPGFQPQPGPAHSGFEPQSGFERQSSFEPQPGVEPPAAGGIPPWGGPDQR